MYSFLKKKTASRVAALLGACAFVLIAAGCHHNNLDSGFGVAWTTLSTTDETPTLSSDAAIGVAPAGAVAQDQPLTIETLESMISDGESPAELKKKYASSLKLLYPGG